MTNQPDKIIPCGSEEMKNIQWQLKQADNFLIEAQDRSLDDLELTENILVVRRQLTDLINRLD